MLTRAAPFLLMAGALAACDAAPAQPPAACALPTTVAAIPAQRFDPAEVRDVPVTGYLLALSWSPEYCARGGRDDAVQCRDNRFGFVVHGLWPQGAGDRRPRACAPAGAIDAATVAEHLCMMPGRALIADQWASHGTCGWPDAASYLARTATLYGALTLPDPAPLATAGALRDAVAATNPGMPRGAIAVDRTRDGAFEELRICYDRAFAYRRCARAELGAPDGAPLKVRPRA